jgi:malate dehydrogenase (quinone)
MGKIYSNAILGAGVIGSADLYIGAHYTDIDGFAIIEQYADPGQVNSSSWNNSQTLHSGDIETNYTPEKARTVHAIARRIAHYIDEHIDGATRALVHRKFPKMVIGVGPEEAALLRKRHEDLRELFPHLRHIGREELRELEPAVIEGRPADVPLAALATPEGYAVDFGRLSDSFIKQALASGKTIDTYFSTKIHHISRDSRGIFHIETDKGDLEARTLTAATGAHSLLFAQQLGYGKDYGILPVAGNFYHVRGQKPLLNGKVYTVQDEKLPFAAVHGDPDLNDPAVTRFGPTAKVLPFLERGKHATIIDFIKTSLGPRYLASLASILTDPVVFKFALKNIAYDLPLIGKRLFLKDVRKIVPTVTAGQLERAKGVGGIRPQLVDLTRHELVMGEAKIPGENCIFNITPSPGASVCLNESDTRYIATFLGKTFHYGRFREAFA